MQIYLKHKVKKIDIDGWGEAHDLTLGHADEDGYHWECFFEAILTEDDLNELIAFWYQDRHMFLRVMKGKTL
jgi:hypothetical protein